MYFFAGLGNPGTQYAFTRHNVGWLFLDFWQKNHHFPEFTSESKFHAEISKNKDYFLIKPQTYMNKSGEAVRSIIHFYAKEKLTVQPLVLENLFVIHDDLDIPFGKFKIQFGTGPKVHNGINSLRQHLGTDQFYYIRIGVDGRSGNRSLPGHAYVLQTFSTEERATLEKIFSEINIRLHQEQKIV